MQKLSFFYTSEMASLSKSGETYKKIGTYALVSTIVTFLFFAIATNISPSASWISQSFVKDIQYGLGIISSACLFISILSCMKSYHDFRKANLLDEKQKMTIEEMIVFLRDPALPIFKKTHKLQQIGLISLFRFVDALTNHDTYTDLHPYLKEYILNNPNEHNGLKAYLETKGKEKYLTLIQNAKSISYGTSENAMIFYKPKVIAQTLYSTEENQLYRKVIHYKSLVVLFSVFALVIFSISLTWNYHLTRNLLMPTQENIALWLASTLLFAALVSKIIASWKEKKLETLHNIENTTCDTILKYYQINQNPSSILLSEMLSLEMRSFLVYLRGKDLTSQTRQLISQDVMYYAQKQREKWAKVTAEESYSDLESYTNPPKKI